MVWQDDFGNPVKTGLQFRCKNYVCKSLCVTSDYKVLEKGYCSTCLEKIRLSEKKERDLIRTKNFRKVKK